MTDQEKVVKARNEHVLLPTDVLKPNIVCVYGFFAVKDDEEICFYVGKTTDLNDRILSSSHGHVHLFLQGYTQKKLPPKLIQEYHDRGYTIKVKILKRVDYHDTCFSRAAHRLALAEYRFIVKYQEKGQCLRQYPDAVAKGGPEEEYWNKEYKIEE